MKNRKFKILVVSIVSSAFLCACSVSEKEVNVSQVEVSGTISEYVKVVDNTYKFTNNDKEAYITIEFELIKKPNQVFCRKKHPESIRLNAKDGNNSIFDTGSYGFEASRTEMSKLKDLLNNGSVGSKKSISFVWNYYGVSKDIGKPLFKNATSFEIIDNTFSFCDQIVSKDIHWDDADKEIKDNVSNISNSSGSEDWDAVLESYEEYIDQYIKLMKKANNGDASAIVEYMEYMEKATELTEKMQKSQGSLSASQLSKFNKLQTKLIKAIEEIN